ncbi:hypothetical protein [Microvirga solisilvae]|uniref:hypothetical protein n=1 Tax=Microvirga solisilvae TaxID=2919498 RepID=UPI001FAFA875|nr:hypothetical protein [Microvirga solisilvae]
MKKFLIATSTLACLLGAPLAAQAAQTAQAYPPTSSEAAQPQTHKMPKHHASKHQAVRHHTAMNKNKASCPPGSQSAACHTETTGSVK